MKFNVDKQSFHKAIATVEGIIPARDIRSIISNILLETRENEIVLTATDLEMGMKTSLPATVHEAGTITLPARKLSQSVREFRGSELQFTSDNDQKVTIQDASGVSRARITIMGTPGEEYPVIPTLNDTKYKKLNPAVINEMIRKTAYAIAEEDSRYVFNGLYIVNQEKKLLFVATDGRRLSKIARDVSETLPFKDGVILPNKAVKELQKILDAEKTFEIAFEEKDRRVYFRIAGIDLICKLIDGQFPDYEQVIPKKLEKIVSLNRLEFENSLRQVSVMAAEPTRQVKLNFQSKNLTIDATTPDLGNAQDILNCDYEGEDITMAFNAGFILDTIKTIINDNIKISFSTASAPSLIQDPDDADLVSVIMPMKL